METGLETASYEEMKILGQEKRYGGGGRHVRPLQLLKCYHGEECD